MSDAPLKRYTLFFEQLTADNFDQLGDVMTDDVHFVDPFNDVRGIEKAKQLFADMFEKLDDAKFIVTHAAMAEELEPASAAATLTAKKEPAALLSWELRASLRDQPFVITGMSEVRFAPDGRVNEHIDHWDAAQQFYERLPIIGWLLKTIRGRMSV